MIEEMFKHIKGAEVKQQDPKVLDVKAPAPGLGTSFTRILPNMATARAHQWKSNTEPPWCQNCQV